MFENFAAFNTPMNTPSDYYQSFSEPASFLSRAASGLGGYIKNNPNQFAITADMIGSKLAPNNPFAGVGQAMGKSNIAASAAEEGKNKMQLLQKLIGALTEGDAPGGNKITLKRGPKGLVVDSSANVGLEDLGLGGMSLGDPVSEGAKPFDTEAFLKSIAIPQNP